MTLLWTPATPARHGRDQARTRPKQKSLSRPHYTPRIFLRARTQNGRARRASGNWIRHRLACNLRLARRVTQRGGVKKRVAHALQIEVFSAGRIRPARGRCHVRRSTDPRLVVGRLRARHLSLADLRRHRRDRVVVARPAGDLRAGPVSGLEAPAAHLPRRAIRSHVRPRLCRRDRRLRHGRGPRRKYLAHPADDRGLHAACTNPAMRTASRCGAMANWPAAPMA